MNLPKNLDKLLIELDNLEITAHGTVDQAKALIDAYPIIKECIKYSMQSNDKIQKLGTLIQSAIGESHPDYIKAIIKEAQELGVYSI